MKLDKNDRINILPATSHPHDLNLNLIVCPGIYNKYNKNNDECLFVYLNDCRSNIYKKNLKKIIK